jgi:hypothetical protein
MIKGARRSPRQSRGSSRAFGAVVVVALLAAAGLAYFYLSDRGQEPHGPAPLSDLPDVMATPPPEPLGNPPPAGAQPSTQPRAVETPVALPALDESDPLIRRLAGEASARPELRTWLGASELARRFVAGVANVAEGESPRKQLLFLAPEERFRVVQKNGHLVADPRSYARYDLAAEVFASLDVPSAVRAYRLLLPLFEEAFSDLGIPERSFEGTLARAIQELLAAPRIEGAVELRRVGSFYEYPDEELEGLSPAQRHLLRMGPRNALRIQSKLRQLQSALGLAEGQG